MKLCRFTPLRPYVTGLFGRRANQPGCCCRCCGESAEQRRCCGTCRQGNGEENREDVPPVPRAPPPHRLLHHYLKMWERQNCEWRKVPRPPTHIPGASRKIKTPADAPCEAPVDGAHYPVPKPLLPWPLGDIERPNRLSCGIDAGRPHTKWCFGNVWKQESSTLAEEAPLGCSKVIT